jgi:hypothetical protein
MIMPYANTIVYNTLLTQTALPPLFFALRENLPQARVRLWIIS